MAIVINKGGTDKTVIEGIREFIAQPFQAPDWLDLRIGFLLSLTQAGADDTITGLTETIGTEPRPILGWDDRVRIGLTDRATGTIFLGFTNRGNGGRATTVGSSKLVSSDSGITTANTNFWRIKNEINDIWTAQIVDTDITRAISSDGVQPHFAQNAAGAGGYATMLGLRLQRDDIGAHAKVITMTIKANVAAHNADILFTNAPTKDLLQANLQSFPATVQQFGPITLSQVPDTLFLYWPFRLSRLRIHAMGIVKTR